jgi:beta-galactosidase/beta-glucuronidase
MDAESLAGYPRPDMKRREWLSLNGAWSFELDPGHQGMSRCWHVDPDFSRSIIVPFAFQSEMSGIDGKAVAKDMDEQMCDHVWYAREFAIPMKYGKYRTILLNFGAVDWKSTVFLNGHLVGEHVGGLTGFCFDISRYLAEDRSGKQLLVVRVEDPPHANETPRGKQTTERARHSGLGQYEASLGIWQPVWLEFVDGPVYFDRDDVAIRTEPGTGKIQVSVQTRGTRASSQLIEACVLDTEDAGTAKPVSEPAIAAYQPHDKLRNAWLQDPFQLTLSVDPAKIERWCPENPRLYVVNIRLVDGEAEGTDPGAILDQLDCTFGFRTAEVHGNRFLLNEEERYVRSVLYQGYFPESLWTPPSEAAIRNDLALVLEMGFNSVRVHQIVEDPRFYYWADKMGVLIWAEMANNRAKSGLSKEQLMTDWSRVVRQNRNHPSIVTWIPTNESWGTGDLGRRDNQEWLRTLYHLTKTFDPTIPCVDNDGWEHVCTDILTIHDYSSPEVLESHYPRQRPENLGAVLLSTRPKRKPWPDGVALINGPVMITEWGGRSVDVDHPDAVDEHGVHRDPTLTTHDKFVQSWEQLVKLYAAWIDFFASHRSWITGNCYCQFCDQFQEINGLLKFNRMPKGDLQDIKKLNQRLN